MVIIALLLAVLSLAWAEPAHASSEASCQFRLGFRHLSLMLPGVVGSCVTDEQYHPSLGESRQFTTRGMLVWRSADNWTAFTDGSRTWINGPFGVLDRPNEARFFWEADYEPGLDPVAPVRVPLTPPWTEVVRGQPSSGVVALTFDAGGVAGPTQRILNTLRSRGQRVSFYVSGHWAERYPDLARQIALDGHEISNHTYTHRDLTLLSDAEITWEMNHTNYVIHQLTGQQTRPFFRPPFGNRDRRVLEVAAGSGYRSVYWTLDSGDWREGATAAQVAQRVLRSSAGDIVVLHVAAEATAQALPSILDGFRSRGLRVGTVSEALGLDR